MAEMMRYAEMKDSGVDWLGEIPSHWSKQPLKTVALVARGGSPRPIEDYLTSDDTGLNWIKIGDTIKGYKFIEKVRQKIRPEGLAKTRMVHKGDLILTNSMSFGEPYILNIDGCIHDGWVCLQQLKIKKEFLYYLLSSPLCMEQFQLQVAGGVVKNLNVDKIGTTIIFIPPAKEQEAISSYLDDQCAQIDDIIASAKASIEEYKAWKASVIYEAVTKGLDASVEMKDSGVEWIGMMPSHWGTIALKLATSKIGSGKTPSGGSEVYSSEGIMFLRSQNVYNTGLILDDVSFISEEIDEEMKNTRVQYRDVLLNITGGSIGRCCLFDKKERANVNQHVCIIRTIQEKILPEYLRYFWNSACGPVVVEKFQTGGNRAGLNFEQIGSVKIPWPAVDEQQKIVAHLDSLCREIDQLISEKEGLIVDLESYKKSLIYEVVTGKRKV